MFHPSCSIRHAAILLGALALQSASLVHGLPKSVRAKTPTEKDIPAMQLSDLDLRQDMETRDIPDVLAKFPSGPLNMFLRMISSLPAGAAALDSAGKILTPLQQGLADSVGIDTVRDDMAQNAACTDITVVFARGTTEPGNIGLVTGPPFFDALREQLESKSLAFQGVEYPATFAGFNKNGTEGVPSMTGFITQAIADCPNTKVVMSGYSQGALVVRSAAETLPAEIMAKINAVLTFGDPRNPAAIPGAEGKTKIICHENDAVCSGGFITIDHLTYGEDVSAAAQFVLQKASGM
ncbi:cutinase [Colletotrichum incanum]|nr:cutinase [Colletotrichum incanum]